MTRIESPEAVGFPRAAAALVGVLIILVAAGLRGHRFTGQDTTSALNRGRVSSQAIFTDMGPGSGVDYVIQEPRRPFTIKQSVGHGAALIDYDGDGLPDIVLLGPDSVKLYHNDGNWHFTDVTSTSGLRQPGLWQGVAVGDYDNDGYPDLYVCGYNCSALYHNEHGHGFKEVTEQAGLAVGPPDKDGFPEWRSSAAFVDVDQDGLLDLYVGRYVKFNEKSVQLCGGSKLKVSCTPEVYQPEFGSLYMNLGGGHFRDETKKRGLGAASGRTLGIAIADYDGDGWVDIALANDEMPGNLFHNKGHGYFEEIGKASGTAYDSSGRAHGGMGIDWGDYANDGKLDLFVTTYEIESKVLYRNLGHSTFMDRCGMAGIEIPTDPWVAWGTKFLDYDNDGWLDLFLVNGHVMDNVAMLGKGGHYKQPLMLFHNQHDGAFADVSRTAGPVFQTRIAGRAVCVGDLDNDGAPDLVVVNLEGKPLLLRNTCPNRGHWIGLQLEGVRSNRMGIGSEVRVSAGNLKLLRVCTTTGSVLSAHDPRVLVGIGSEHTAQRVSIRWPSGRVDDFANVSADRYYTAVEGSKVLRPMNFAEPHQRASSIL